MSTLNLPQPPEGMHWHLGRNETGRHPEPWTLALRKNGQTSATISAELPANYVPQDWTISDAAHALLAGLREREKRWEEVQMADAAFTAYAAQINGGAL